MGDDPENEPDAPNSTTTTVASSSALDPVEYVVSQFEHALEQGLDHEVAIGNLDLPTDQFEDQYRDRDDDRKSFDAMLRAFIYMRVKGLSYSEMERQFDRWGDLPHLLRFDVDYVSRGTFSYAKQHRFDEEAWQFIVEASDRIREVAEEHGVRPEYLADGGRDTPGVDDGGLKKVAVRRTRELVFGAWTTDRADNRSYSDEDHIRQAAYMAMADSGTPAGSRRHEATNADAMAGNTHLDITKRYDVVDVVRCFRESVGAVYDVLKFREQFAQPAICAVDITPYPYWGEPDANPMMARMTSGMRPEKQSPYALKFATITTAGDTIPTILGIVPVQEESPWGGTTYPTAKQVGQLLDQATDYVSVSLLLMDREYDSLTVAREVTERDVTFLTPLSNRRDHQDYHIEYMRRQEIHVDVEPWYLDVRDPDGTVDQTLMLQHLYVPSTQEGTRTQVFRTNDPWVDVDTAEGFATRYRTRWDVENQFKTIKNEFLALTTSRVYVVRMFYFYLGCALQNAWRLADFYYQDAHPDLEYDGAPELTAGEFVDLAAKELGGLLDF